MYNTYFYIWYMCVIVCAISGQTWFKTIRENKTKLGRTPTMDPWHVFEKRAPLKIGGFVLSRPSVLHAAETCLFLLIALIAFNQERKWSQPPLSWCGRCCSPLWNPGRSSDSTKKQVTVSKKHTPIFTKYAESWKHKLINSWVFAGGAILETMVPHSAVVRRRGSEWNIFTTTGCMPTRNHCFAKLRRVHTWFRKIFATVHSNPSLWLGQGFRVVDFLVLFVFPSLSESHRGSATPQVVEGQRMEIGL